jgi:hypothetical protein
MTLGGRRKLKSCPHKEIIAKPAGAFTASKSLLLHLTANSGEGLLGFLNVCTSSLNASFDEHGLHFRLLSGDQVDFGFERQIARRFDFNAVLTRADQ